MDPAEDKLEELKDKLMGQGLVSEDDEYIKGLLEITNKDVDMTLKLLTHQNKWMKENQEKAFLRCVSQPTQDKVGENDRSTPLKPPAEEEPEEIKLNDDEKTPGEGP